MKNIYLITLIALQFAGCKVATDKNKNNNITGTMVQVKGDSYGCVDERYVYSTVKIDTTEYMVFQDNHGIFVLKK